MTPLEKRPRSSLLGIFALAAAFGTLLFVLLVPTWDAPWIRSNRANGAGAVSR